MATAPGFRPVGLERFVFVGTRDLTDGQRRKLEASAARVVYGGGGGGEGEEEIASRRDFPGDLARVLGQGDEGLEC